MTDVSELGLLRMGVGEVWKGAGDQEKHIGYVLATPDARDTWETGVGAQYQRWLLFELTDNDFEVRPTQDPTLAGLTLAGWGELVRTKWREGARQIWGRARIYVHGGTYGGVTWTSLPAELPEALDPKVEGIGFQIDVTGGKPSLVGLHQETARGLAFAVAGEGAASTHEYWLTAPAYRPVGQGSSVRVRPDARSLGSLKDFSRLAAADWAPGASLTVVGCVAYTGKKPFWKP